MEEHSQIDLSIQRDLGRISAELTQAHAERAFLKMELVEVKRDIAEIKDILNQSKGGWRVIVVFGSIAATVGALFVSLLDYLWS